MTAIKMETLATDPRNRLYHTRAELIEVSMLTILRFEEGPSEIGNLLVRIPGVSSVTLFPYSVKIFRAERYDWGEIDSQVLEILEGLENVCGAGGA